MMKATIRYVLAVCLLAALSGIAQAAPDYKTWYLAEGSTGVFEEEILIANPNAVAANVTITYLVATGVTAPPAAQVVVPATGRKTVTVPAGYTAISAVLTSDQAIIVERSMYLGGAARLAGHNSSGVTTPAVEWYLAEGANGGFDTYVLIANPNANATTVELTFLGSDGVTKVLTTPVSGLSRKSVHARVDAGVTSVAFSARVKSLDASSPIIVERAMYWGTPTAPGATNEKGLTQLSSTWRFGEGYTANGFETYVLLGNPNATDASVTTTFFLEDGTTVQEARTVAANTRQNIYVNGVPGMSGKPFSILVQCTNGLEIAAERAMYWGGFREGHAVAGIADEATTWGFAEGLEDRFNGLDYDTYFLLNNAGDTAVSVKATFLLEDGTGFQDTFTVGAHARKTLPTGAYLQLSNKRFATFFEASGPIVAERSVYWGPNYYGGHASAGTPWPLGVVPPGVAPTGPTVTAIAPAYGSTNGGTDVTITGTNFRQDATVTIGGAAARNVVVRDAQTITFTTPGATAGAKAVVVRSFGQTASNQPAFTYEAPTPPPPTGPTIAQGNPVAIYCNAFAGNGVCTSVVQFPFPQNLGGVIAQLAAERPDLLNSSCTATGGNNRFMFEAVRRLRAATGSNRWGMNWKRGNVGDLSQDIVTYFYGPRGTEMEGDIRVYLFDIIGGHCGNSPSWNWADVTDATRSGGTIARWTTAGQNF
jgi:hypothetical protein